MSFRESGRLQKFTGSAFVFLIFVVASLVSPCLSTDKIDWFDPCNYNISAPRHSRVSRAVEMDLLNQINISIDTMEEAKKYISKLYKVNNYSCNGGKIKFNFIKYYRIFTVLGDKLDKLLAMKIVTHDSDFNKHKRELILTKARYSVKSVMCEFYDHLVVQENISIANIAVLKPRVPKFKIPKSANLSVTIKSDICVIDFCKKLLVNFKALVVRKIKRENPKKPRNSVENGRNTKRKHKKVKPNKNKRKSLKKHAKRKVIN